MGGTNHRLARSFTQAHESDIGHSGKTAAKQIYLGVTKSACLVEKVYFEKTLVAIFADKLGTRREQDVTTSNFSVVDIAPFADYRGRRK